ncbi:hypothetical protein [Paenibacillus hamazuiensis]|uniref:hypothetical protein n=1 Tax=Paenibacillus hamazuiensis TaxID=2936508 RepID=UPI00200C07A1|nr:hypothetical protein [Paenibacillus hamazuiensis]
MKQQEDDFDDYERGKNEITEYVSPDQIIIPYVEDSKVNSYLDQMTTAARTFKEDYKVGYSTEYGNDMDEYGYITGIELRLSLEAFIDLVKNQAFKVIRTEWKNKEYHLISFDHEDIVFNPENVIYKLTDQEDAFVIVKLEEPEKLGHHHLDQKDRCPIALVKGLISARGDIYPLEYMLQPNFYLRKNSSFYFIGNDNFCEDDAWSTWSAMPEEQRKNIINNIHCEHCSDKVQIVEYTVHSDPYGLWILGKCTACSNRIAGFVERN